MEMKGEVVNGPVLMAKQEAFEEALEVPSRQKAPWIRVASTILSSVGDL